jgi:hypothetical protein
MEVSTFEKGFQQDSPLLVWWREALHASGNGRILSVDT